MKQTIAIVHGPNLNWLGKRETALYGKVSWGEVWERLQARAAQEKLRMIYFHSNSEGALLDYLQNLEENVGGILLNAGAYSHTSIALRDGVASLSVPVVEVHITKLQKREPFRHFSYLADVVVGSITGFGTDGYFLGLALLKTLLQ